MYNIFMSFIFIVTDVELCGSTLDDHVSEGNSEKVGLLILTLNIICNIACKHSL